ncbi:hypothetical protein A3715_13975 [Oleiphilus sp. HI0009]|nr:hypothetical protein A3715_13975 [Oleiphilus sp. HI0009]
MKKITYLTFDNERKEAGLAAAKFSVVNYNEQEFECWMSLENIIKNLIHNKKSKEELQKALKAYGQTLE